MPINRFVLCLLCTKNVVRTLHVLYSQRFIWSHFNHQLFSTKLWFWGFLKILFHTGWEKASIRKGISKFEITRNKTKDMIFSAHRCVWIGMQWYFNSVQIWFLWIKYYTLSWRMLNYLRIAKCEATFWGTLSIPIHFSIIFCQKR